MYYKFFVVFYLFAFNSFVYYNSLMIKLQARNEKIALSLQICGVMRRKWEYCNFVEVNSLIDWYAAQCQFSIDHGTSLVKTFDLFESSGNYMKMPYLSCPYLYFLYFILYLLMTRVKANNERIARGEQNMWCLDTYNGNMAILKRSVLS